MKLWSPLDKLGYVLATWWTPRLQVRTGTVMTILGVALVPYGLLSSEPFVIYEMSALALVIGGMGILVTAVLAVKEDPHSDEEDLKPNE